MNFDHRTIEAKWRKKWQESGVYRVDLKNPRKKFYNLMMFPYPSAEGLHVGNMYAFTGADVYGRFKAMNGYDVFEPIGLDGFGIHSENYAIQIAKHPAEQAKISEKRYYHQLSRIANRFSWEQRLETYDPDYYRWTQWLFIKMFKKGLAYRKKAQVNWCPSCKTVLADEQVEAGVCERCKMPVKKRETEQWFFRITQYAQRLLDNIEKIDWPEKIKISQRNWIGRSEGVEISWKMTRTDLVRITTFTTRPDTIYGVSFLVIAPDHPLLDQLKLSEKVQQYRSQAMKKTEQKRKAGEKEKTGVDTGYQAVHPLTGKKIAIWVADFVLMGYGTGVVMGVPAYDERDRAFAKKYQFPVIDKLVDKKTVFSRLKKIKAVRKKVHYHLRDWCISRQRYWGPPIPMIYCEKCARNSTPGRLHPRGEIFRHLGGETDRSMPGWYPEKEENLPVILPYLKNFKPTSDGKPPLERASKEWLYVKCPKCASGAKRETEVSDTFLDSSWYFLRYPSSTTGSDPEGPFDPGITRRWLPVDAYIGGAEHAVLHLMYSRFVWMALQDWGYIPKQLGDEPFPFLYGHGLIIKDGAKMSKSKGNIVIPDEYIDRFGVDALRLYLMFIGPFDQGGDFRDTGMKGMSRFLGRIEKLSNKVRPRRGTSGSDLEVSRLQHQTIKRVTKTIAKFRYNVAIAALMEYVNELEKIFTPEISTPEVKSADTSGVSLEAIKTLVLLLAPFAPCVCEELWSKLGGKFSVHQQPWPQYDEALARGETVTIVVQVNAKLRASFELPKAEAEDKTKIITQAKANERVKKHLAGKNIVKEIFVPGKLVNFVAK